jgi:rhamnosyltransferase
MTVQDATPADERWLEKLLAGFEDEHVAGVCGQQVVPHDKSMNPVQWYRPYSEPTMTKVAFPSPEAFHQASPAEKKRATGWDDVNAMYRRDILLQVPFRRMIFGEDSQWALDALLAGYCIVYNDNARVYHYHHDRPDVTYKRMFSACYIRYKVAGFFYPREGFGALLIAARILFREELSLKEKLRWFWYNYRTRAAVNKAIKDFNGLACKGEQCVEESYS